MTDSHGIHDLLDRAVRDHTPLRTDPYGAVVARAQAGRRRSTALAAVAIAAVMTGVALVVPTGEAPLRPAAPVTGAEQSYDLSPEPSEEAARREAEAAAAVAAALAAEERGSFSVAMTDNTLVPTPDGWTSFPTPGDDAEPDEVVCSPDPRTVYRTLVVVEAPGTLLPCLGIPVAPYLWDGAAPGPRIDLPVRQSLLGDGTPVWLQTASPFARGPVTYLWVPTTGQATQSVGLSVEELLAELTPEQRSFGGPIAPLTFDGGLTVILAAEGKRYLTTDEEEELAVLLRSLPEADRSSLAACPDAPVIGQHWQIQLPDGFLVVDVWGPDCAAVTAMAGGVRAPSPALVQLLLELTR